MSTKIFVADNNPQRKSIVEAAFDEDSFLLSFAENGKEAVVKYDAFKPDFLIANDELEDVSEIKLFRILKKSGKIKENQFILLTQRGVDASSFPENIHLLGKPFKATDIAHLIEEMTMERMSSDEFDEKEAEMDAIVENLRRGNEEVMKEIDTSTLASAEPVMELSTSHIVEGEEPTGGLEVIDDLLEANDEELSTMIDENDPLDISSQDENIDIGKLAESDVEIAPQNESATLEDVLDLSDAQFAKEVKESEQAPSEDASSTEEKEEKQAEGIEESLLNYYEDEALQEDELKTTDEPVSLLDDEESVDESPFPRVGASEPEAENKPEPFNVDDIEETGSTPSTASDNDDLSFGEELTEEDLKENELAGKDIDDDLIQDEDLHLVHQNDGRKKESLDEQQVDLSFGEELTEEDLKENELAGKDIDDDLIQEGDIIASTLTPAHAGSFESDVAHHVRASLDKAIEKEVQQAVTEAFPEIVKRIDAEIQRIAPDIIRDAIQKEIARLKGE